MLSEKQFLDSFMPHRYLVEILCKQIFEDEDMAKDSVQDIYLKLWQQRDSLDELQNPKAYLLRTARNHCLDELRKSHSYGKKQPVSDEILQIIPAGEKNVEEKLVLKETNEKLMKWIKKLKEPKYSLFVMAHFRHCSNDEIALSLGLSAVNVRVMLSRLRREARKICMD
ncbi:RNA polymerase sigma factor [Porphyromonas macacae]|uniref:RNA polymerase sigma factor n=2 Tax=Porphyromonas macacae TaxID=28115 RepID=A0A379E985_9PORP|nr:sigma-70 family RNA polymerase sigma factor [Porphyromonas macacae]SUB89247.1 RNA polymerase sigma factor [Porphyromonas macacae]